MGASGEVDAVCWHTVATAATLGQRVPLQGGLPCQPLELGWRSQHRSTMHQPSKNGAQASGMRTAASPAALFAALCRCGGRRLGSRGPIRRRQQDRRQPAVQEVRRKLIRNRIQRQAIQHQLQEI